MKKIILTIAALLCLMDSAFPQAVDSLYQPRTFIGYLDDDYASLVKGEFIYDERGRLIMTTDTVVEPLGESGGWNRLDYTYDESSNLIRKKEYAPRIDYCGACYDTYYYYNDKGQLDSIASYWLDPYSWPALWLIRKFESYSYDDRGLMTERKSAIIKGESPNIYISGYKTYTYHRDDDGTLLEINLDDEYKTLYSYDESGQYTSLLSMKKVSGEWVNTQKIDYEYEDGKIYRKTSQIWSDESWCNTERTIWYYDEGGNVIRVEIEKWIDGEWIPRFHMLRELDTDGKLVRLDYEILQDGEWMPQFCSVDSYSPETCCNRDDYSPYFDNRLEEQNYMLKNSFFYRFEITSYVETPNPSYSIEEHDLPEESFATIHPNPATATVTIVGEGLRQIEITDMLGQRVATHQAEGPQATIDISALPTGIYFVGITDENGKRCVRKVVKE